MFPNKAQVEKLRQMYPQGTRVELLSMSDPYTSLTQGAAGTVDFVDDTGTVFVAWDNGSHLGAVYGEDEVRLLPKRMSETVKEQILAVRATSKTNMFDTNAVQRIAFNSGYHELADFIFMDTKRYSNLILTGELENVE